MYYMVGALIVENGVVVCKVMDVSSDSMSSQTSEALKKMYAIVKRRVATTEEYIDFSEGKEVVYDKSE